MRRLAWLDDMVVYFAILAAGFARDYFLRLQARSREAVALQARAVQLQAEAARLEAQLAEARLSALRAQLDPHFLFNTLNAVSALVERDPRGVRRMIARLSDLLRHSIEGRDEPEVPLRDELAPIWKGIMGDHYPAIALVEVVRLLERAAKVEIEATAVVPEE